MTVATETATITHTGNGVLTGFSAPFKFLSNDDLQVTKVTIATGAATIMTPAEYTITGAGNENGGTVTITPAVTSSFKIKIDRIVPLTQDTDLEREGGFFPDVIEAQLDRIVMMVQQLDAALADATGSGIISSITRNVAGPSSSTIGRFASFNVGTGNSLADSGFAAADFALAAHTHADAWTEKDKAANFTKTSSIALSSDPDLTFNMVANTTYLIECRLYINSLSTSGFRVGITGPASPTLLQCVGFDIDDTGNFGAFAASSYTTVRNNTPASTENIVLTLQMRIANGANAGAFAIQFAQGTSNAAAATLYKGSYMRYKIV